MHRFALFGRNAALTAISVTLWATAGYVVGFIAGGVREPTALDYIFNNAAVLTKDLEQFYAIRDGVIHFCAWCGLVCAQVVFVVQHFGGGPHPPGGFPVKEL